MNLTKLIKREIIITVATILLISTTFFGVTYAVYMSIDEKNVGTISFGDISFEMCADSSCSQLSGLGTVISGELYPMSEAEGLSQTPYTFVATNSGNKSVHLTTYAATHTNIEEDYSKIKIATKLSTEQNYTYNLMTDEAIIVKENIEIAAGESKTINLLVWGTEELSNEMIGETFYLFINAIAYYYPDDPNGEYETIVANVNPYLAEGIDFSYINDYQEWEAPTSGYYQIEAWGAQGGSLDLYTSTKNGGMGSYVSGEVFLTAGEKLYIYTGGQGADITSPGSLVGFSNTSQSTIIPGGYNGGGAGIDESDGDVLSANDTSTSGGGATDVRFFGDTLPTEQQLQEDNAIGLNSRIMVAAGGSGARNYDSTDIPGNAGGGLTSKLFNEVNYATQVAGESFGVGYDGTFVTSGTFDWGISGAGGGFYGGVIPSSDGTPPTLINAPENVTTGGTSYISGYAGVNSVTLGNTAAPRVHTDEVKHYSNKYFLNGKMISGANEGNGRVRITYKGLTSIRTNSTLDNVKYIKDCVYGNATDSVNRWQEIQAIVNGVNIAKGKTAGRDGGTYLYSTQNITDGKIGVEGFSDGYSDAPCIYIDLGVNPDTEDGLWDLDELAVWHSWQPNFKNTISPTTTVSADNITWVTVMESTSNIETPEGKRVVAFEQ